MYCVNWCKSWQKVVIVLIHFSGCFFCIVWTSGSPPFFILNKLYSFCIEKSYVLTAVLQHLRLEENPILKMPHLEAASILLVGPTLKKFNDRGILWNISVSFLWIWLYFVPWERISSCFLIYEPCLWLPSNRNPFLASLWQLVPPFLNLVSHFYRISHVSIKPTQTPLQGKKKVAIIIDIIVVESELMLTVLEVYPC